MSIGYDKRDYKYYNRDDDLNLGCDEVKKEVKHNITKKSIQLYDTTRILHRLKTHCYSNGMNLLERCKPNDLSNFLHSQT